MVSLSTLNYDARSTIHQNETHYCGLTSLTMLHWATTSGKLRVLCVKRLKNTYSLFQNIDSILQCNFYIYICCEPPPVKFPRSRTQAHTHTHKHGRISPSQTPITTQNTTKHPCPERELNLFYLQSTDIIPHGHKERQFFTLHIKFIFPENIQLFF